MKNKNKFNILDITNKILEIEQKNNLLEKKIKKVYFWKIIRFQLTNEILEKLENHGSAHKNSSLLKLLLKNLIRSIFYKQRTLKSESIIFTHDRFFLNAEKKYEDIYTYFIINHLKSNCEVIYPFFIKKEYINDEYNYSTQGTASFFLALLKQKFFIQIYKKKKFIRDEKMEAEINTLKREMELYFNIENLESLKIQNINKILIKYLVEKQFYSKLFQKKSPKKIYIVCSYGKEALISAAQDLGIEVIEIQHGMFGKYELAYHFPQNIKVPYFPDKMLIFGQYWIDITSIPLSKNKIEIIGYPYMENQIKKYENSIVEKENQILFVSQGTIGEKLTEKAVEFAKLNPKFKVIVRLHPGEFSRWKKDYNILLKNKNLKNLFISDNNKKNLYEFLCESRYVIGVYSTVIYEALYLEKKVGVLKLPGVEYMDDLIEKKVVKMFDVSEAIDISKLEKLKRVDGQYYFATAKNLFCDNKN